MSGDLNHRVRVNDERKGVRRERAGIGEAGVQSMLGSDRECPVRWPHEAAARAVGLGDCFGGGGEVRRDLNHRVRVNEETKGVRRERAGRVRQGRLGECSCCAAPGGGKVVRMCGWRWESPGAESRDRNAHRSQKCNGTRVCCSDKLL